jgi:hypothetical protein
MTPIPAPVPTLALAHLRLAEGGPREAPGHTRSRTLAALVAALALALGGPLFSATAEAATTDHPAATVPGKPGLEDDGGADGAG